MSIEELIHFCNSKKMTVCVVGAGGKTSLITRIAEASSLAGKNVLVTTTTHIFKPDQHYADCPEEVFRLWNNGDYAVIGKDAENQKLTFSKDLFEAVSENADLILVEADGSKRLPCKIPADHEPVILPDCDLVIGVMGMTAIGQLLKDICFRFAANGQWLKLKEEDILTPEIAARILCDEKGTKKNVADRDYIIVLNQCDDFWLMSQAEMVKNEIKKNGDIPVVCTALQKRD